MQVVTPYGHRMVIVCHRMVIVWSPYGHRMVTVWPSHGHRMVIVWSPYGHRMVTVWTPYDHRMVTISSHISLVSLSHGFLEQHNLGILRLVFSVFLLLLRNLGFQ